MKTNHDDCVPCECGCGMLIPRFDSKHKPRRFVKGHHNRLPHHVERAKLHGAPQNVGRTPWNKGTTYTFAKVHNYANKAAWHNALVRHFGEKCMRCNWDEAQCDAHHIVPKREGGQFTLENGVLLCPNCHRLADIGKIAIDELYAMRARAKPIGRRL